MRLPRKLQASARQAYVNLSEGCMPPGKLQAYAKQAYVNLSEGWMIFFFASWFYKIVADSSYFRKKISYLQMKELFDSIATQNAEIRTVAKSLLLFLK